MVMFELRTDENVGEVTLAACLFLCSFHILHYLRSVECEMKTEMYTYVVLCLTCVLLCEVVT